jgi:hypothetical protein
VIWTEIGPIMVAEAQERICGKPSGNFKGICFFNDACEIVCLSESDRFDGGHCKGVRCICTYHC